MTNPELFELLDRFEHSSLQTLKLSQPGFTRACGPGGWQDHRRPPGGDLLRGSRSGPAALCRRRREGIQRADRVSD